MNPKEKARKIAFERLKRLLKLAEEVSKSERKLARRYVEIAFRLKMKHKLKIPRRYRLRFCRKCFTFWTSETLRVRIKKDRIEYICLVCGFRRRIPKRKREK